MSMSALNLTQPPEPAPPRNPAVHTGSGAGTGQCVSNISLAEQRKRLRFGIVTFVFGLLILAVLMAVGAAPMWRMGLLPVFAGAASAFFQWRDKT